MIQCEEFGRQMDCKKPEPVECEAFSFCAFWTDKYHGSASLPSSNDKATSQGLTTKAIE